MMSRAGPTSRVPSDTWATNATLALMRPRRRLRAELVQLLYLLAGVVLGVVAPLVHLGPALSSADIRALLFTVGGGIIALVSVIFSLLFLVVQWGSTSFTPRLTLFRDDPAVWRGFGFFVGMFAYNMVAGLAIGDNPTVPPLVPLLCMIQLLIALGIIRRLQLRAFRSIQLSAVLTDIDLQGRAVLDALYPPQPPAVVFDGDDPTTGRDVVWPGRPAVVRELDLSALIGMAKDADAVVVMKVRVGATVQEGAALATVHQAATGPLELTDQHVLGAVGTGIERSFDQDPTLVFRLIVDIAMRALSDAINDQATAVQCLDIIEGLLRHLAGRELDVGRIPDRDGRLRVVLDLPRWEDYVRESIDDVSFAAGATPMTLLRIRTLLLDLLDAVADDRRPPLEQRRELIDQRLQQFPLLWQRITGPRAGSGTS